MSLPSYARARDVLRDREGALDGGPPAFDSPLSSPRRAGDKRLNPAIRERREGPSSQAVTVRVVVGRGDVEADEVRAHHDADRIRLSLEERDVAGFLASHANCVFPPNGRDRKRTRLNSR